MAQPALETRGRGPWIALLVLTLVLVLAGGIWITSLSQPVSVKGSPTLDPWGRQIITETPSQPATAIPIPSVPTELPTELPIPTGEASDSQTPKPEESPSQAPKAEPKYQLSTIAIGSATGLGKEYRYLIKTEKSLGLKANAVAKEVAAIFNDPRGWAGDGEIQFALIKSEKKVDFTVEIRSTATAAVAIESDVIVISGAAWGKPTATYADPVEYQRYLVNHGAGLWLGKKSKKCPGKGKQAPIMLDQSTDLGGCVANPWPNT